MTKAQAFRYSLMYIMLILFGWLIAFNVWWTNGDAKFLGVLAFFCVGFGSLFLSITITRIFAPSNADVGFSMFSDRQKYARLKETLGATTMRIITISHVSLFLLLFAGTSYSLIALLNRYEQKQLDTYGQLQKVKINDIHYKGKGTPYAFFEFYLNGEKHTHDLPPKNYSIGDSVMIIFSTNNPDIVKWSEDVEK